MALLKFTISFFLLFAFTVYVESASIGRRQFHLSESKISDEETKGLIGDFASSPHSNNNNNNNDNKRSSNDNDNDNNNNNNNDNKRSSNDNDNIDDNDSDNDNNNVNDNESFNDKNDNETFNDAFPGKKKEKSRKKVTKTKCKSTYTCVPVNGKQICYWKAATCTSSGW